MPKLSGYNKGEWSEIYVLLRLLELGKLYAADEDLNKLDGTFYNIINIVRNESIGKLEFRINQNKKIITVFNVDKKTELASIKSEEFTRCANNLYKEIINSKKTTFSSEATNAFLQKISVDTIKAKPTDKADIFIRIHDINTGYENVQGFSIKSRLGGASTLINAGKTTNFLYEVVGKIDDGVLNGFNTCSKKFKDRFDYLKSKDCSLNFIKVDNDIFENNLLMLDGSLPKICAYMLMEYYSHRVKKISESLKNISKKNPCKFPLESGQPFYEYKFKKFISECALGMLPSTPWTGRADATGGYIIVREDGEVLCYHLFNRNEFEDYLVKNTKFDTPSTSRHDFGNIFKENGKYYLKLCLQIRFLK